MKFTMLLKSIGSCRCPYSVLIKHFLHYEKSYNEVSVEKPACIALIFQIKELQFCIPHSLLAAHSFWTANRSSACQANSPIL